MAVTTSEEFLAFLEKSDLLAPGDLAEVRGAAADQPDPKAVARQLIDQGLLTRFQAVQLLNGRHVLKLGTYRLMDQIGTGGTGTTYQVECSQTGQYLALKVLSRKLTAHADSLVRFQERVRKIASLDHANVNRVHEVRSQGGRHCLLMEYVPGENLDQRVKEKGPLPLQTVAGYVQQAADGLVYAHQHGVLHGDVKPTHLMLNEQGTIKILDTSTAPLAPAGGTADYAAPETISGGKADARADIYSLGCTFYFLLTGQPPFPEGTDEQKRKKHQQEMPRGVLELRHDVPTELAKICIRMMAKSPEHRLESAAAVSAALQEWLNAESETETQAAADQTDQEMDGALAEAMAASDFDDHLDDKPQSALRRPTTSKGKTAAGAAANSDQDARAGSQIAVAAGGGKLFGLDLSKFLPASDGTPEGDAARKKQLIRGGVAGGLIAVGLILLVWMYVLPIFSDDGKSRSGPSVAAREVHDAPTPPTVDDGKQGKDQPPKEPPGTDDGGTADDPTEEPVEDDGGATVEDPGEEPTDVPDDDSTDDPDNGSTQDNTADTGEGSTDVPDEEPVERPSPFCDLPRQAALPAVDGGSKPGALGPVQLGPEDECSVELIAPASAREAAVTLDPSHPFEGQMTWLVRLKSSADGKATAVGRFLLSREQLSYQWAPQATTIKEAQTIRQCVLRLKCGDDAHVLALQTPSVPEPITADFERNSMRALVNVDWSGDPEALRVEITSLEGAFPPHSFESDKKLLKAADDSTRMLLGEEKNRPLAINVETSLTPKLQLVLTPYFQVLRQEQEQRFNVRIASQVSQKIVLGGRKTQEDLAAAEKRKTNSRDDTQTEKIEARIAELKLQLQEYKTSFEQIQKLKEFYQQVHKKGKIHFRVFYTIDEHEIDLVRTGRSPG